MKKIITIVISILVVFSLSINSYAIGVLDYWHSDHFRICKWDQSYIYVYNESLNSTFDSTLRSAVDRGITQWNNAGINVYATYSQGSADIFAYEER